MAPAVLRAAAGLAALLLAAGAPADQRTAPAAAARPAPRIEGLSVSGQTVDAETGAPVEAEVGVLPAGGSGRPVAHTVSASDGWFQLDLEPGEYTVRAGAPGYTAQAVTLQVAESGAPDLRFALGRGETISGRVVGATGRAAGNLPVVAFDDEGGFSVPVPRWQTAQSLPDGWFTIRGLSPGGHTLAVADEQAGYVILTDVAGGASEVVLRLAPGGRVRALAVRPDGTPAAGVFVGVRTVDGRPASPFLRGSSTDASGVAEWAVPAGHLEIVARGGAAGQASASVTVAAGETGAVEINLQPREAGPGTR